LRYRKNKLAAASVQKKQLWNEKFERYNEKTKGVVEQTNRNYMAIRNLGTCFDMGLLDVLHMAVALPGSDQSD
jgi:hypothetical protein